MSGCDCAPKHCQQTTIAFQQLEQSTKHCFSRFNHPINDVAKKILNDADYLRTIIEQLYNQNPQGHTVAECSFDFKTIETNVKVENEWCHY